VNRTCNRLRQNKANFSIADCGFRKPAARCLGWRGPVVQTGKKKREEVVQGAGMVGPFHAQGAAESNASVRLGVRSHVPGTRRDRAQAVEAGIKKAEPPMRLLPQESAYGPSSQGFGP